MSGIAAAGETVESGGTGPHAVGGGEGWFEALFHGSPDAIFILEAETARILDVNETARRMFEMAPGAELGLTLHDLSLAEPPYTRREALEWVRKTVTDGPQMFEWLHRTTSGRLFWTEVSLRLVRIGGERLIVGHVRDISGRKQAEADLAHTQGLLQAAVEQSPMGIIVADAPDVRIRIANGTALRLRGERPESLVGIPVELHSERWQVFDVDGRLLRPEELPLTRAVVEGRITENFECLVRHADGGGRRLLANAAPVRDSQGRVVAGIVVLLDVTEHRRAQAELDRFFTLSRDLLSIGDFSGRLRRFNPSWERVLGWTTKELLQRPWVDFIHPDDQEASLRAMAGLREGFPVAGFVNRCRCKDGRFRWLSWLSTPYPEDQMVISVARDVTEWRELQERLQQTEKMEAIGQLAGGIAHDFNNQLSGIMGYADLLARRATEPNLARYAQSILGAARRASDLTSTLLSFSRKGQAEPTPVDLHALIGEVVLVLERSLDKRISIATDLRARRAIVMGDSTQLQSALLNLGLNARDAMPEGGRLEFRTDIVEPDESAQRPRLPELSPGKYLRIRVIDNGTGMTDEVKSRIFEPFFTTKKTGRGTGMGLASVYATIRGHDGAIHVASRPGHGTTMSLYLPLTDRALEDPPPAKECVEKRPRRILVVDDEECSREALTEMLQSGGHDVTACRDGVEALEVYREAWKDIDVVVLDMVMPRMNGPATFAALKGVNPDVKVLIASGYSAEGEAEELLGRGAVGFIQKPFECRALLGRVDCVV